MPLQIRRGTAAERSGLTTPLVIGELLYVTDQGKLYIGDGTPIGGADSVGNPGQGGKGLIITGFSFEEAQDAAALLFSNGVHTNINFTYDDINDSLNAQLDLSNYTGNITVNGVVDADFKGSLFADDSGLLVDAVDRKFFGNLEGNLSGSVIGDLQGSVFANDSTLIIDGATATIPASVLTGTFTGNVIGNVTGDVTGSIITNSISSSDSTTINVSTTIAFQTDIQVDGISRFSDELSVQTGAIDQRLISLTQIHDSTNSGSALNLRRARGTLSSPSIISDGDNLGNISFTAYDGTIYTQSSLIRASTAGTISTGRVPGRLEFLTVSEFTGELTEKMYIGSRNEVRLNSELQVYSAVYDPTPMTWFQQSHAVPDARNFTWIRTRGTIDAPLAVQNGDDIVDLTFQGHDGVNTLTQVAAAITVRVDSPVSAGNVRGAFDFLTYNGTSLATRITISSAGLLSALNNLSTPNISPVATDGDLELDPAAKGTGTINFKAPSQTTVGAAGPAAVLPATPSTYLRVKINGSTFVIPAYAAS